MTNSHMRWIVVLMLLFFSWKGVNLDLEWPPINHEVSSPKPADEFLGWAAPVRTIAAKMLPADRLYLSNLYEAMSFILLRDFDRDQPIIKTTDDFVTFHAGTLRLAIEKSNVGKYPGLAEAIDQTFLAALGADQKALDDKTKPRLIAACGALSWTIGIGRDE